MRAREGHVVARPGVQGIANLRHLPVGQPPPKQACQIGNHVRPRLEPLVLSGRQRGRAIARSHHDLLLAHGTGREGKPHEGRKNKQLDKGNAVAHQTADDVHVPGMILRWTILNMTYVW